MADTVNRRKISQDDTITDAEKVSQHKTPRPFRNKEDHEGDINEKNHFANDSQTANDDCIRNLYKEH